MFSGDDVVPLRVDALGLASLTEERLAAALQAGPGNPLVGIASRVALLHRLGEAMAAQPEVSGPLGRPGGLYDRLLPQHGPPTITAHDILTGLLVSLGAIWLADNVIGDQHLGDCWHHDAVSGAGLTLGWMPLHKLSQWLTYSLLEPFGWAGVQVLGLDALTALPEYRNGGLLLDSGVLRLRDPGWVRNAWGVDDELVVEWRALTVALLDELAPLVRVELGLDAARLPLACVLEGGTWAAGRALAERLRGGLPPLVIVRRHGLLMTGLHLVDHLLVQHKLTLLRRKHASTKTFRQLVNEISALMAYEVLRDIPLHDVEVETPMELTTGRVIDGKKLVSSRFCGPAPALSTACSTSCRVPGSVTSASTQTRRRSSPSSTTSRCPAICMNATW